jgi:hypothetical protein
VLIRPTGGIRVHRTVDTLSGAAQWALPSRPQRDGSA